MLSGRLSQGWFWLHFTSLLVAVFQKSTPVVYLGRYSQNAGIIIVFLIITLPLSWLIPKFLRQPVAQFRPPRWLYSIILLAVLMGLILIWGIPVASAAPYLVMRLYLSFIGFQVGLWALERLAEPPSNTTGWRVLMSATLPYILPAIALTVFLGLCVVILRYPGVLWIDEAYMASLSWNFAHTGRIEPLIYEYVDTESYALMYMGLGMWYRLFGFGLWTARIFIFVVGVLMLAITWVIARRLWGTDAAWLGAIMGLFALVPLNVMRQDVSVALYLAAALLVYIIAEQRNRPPLHLIVGFFVAFATDGHPNAYRFSFAFGAAYLLEWGLQIRNQRHFFVYRPLIYLIIGGMLGVGAYIGLYTTLGDDLLSLASSPFLEAAKPPTAVFWDQIIITLQNIPLLFGTAAIGLVVGLRRNIPVVRVVAVVLLVNMGIIAMLYGYYRSYYIAQSLSLYVLLACVAFAEITHLKRPTLYLGIAALLLAANGGYLYRLLDNDERRNGYNDAIQIAADVREILPENTTLVANDPMYFELVDHVEFVEYATAGWAAGKFDVSEQSIWEQVMPDYVIIVYNNPEHPPTSLQAYIEAVEMTPTHCWQSDTIGRVDLFTRTVTDASNNLSTDALLDDNCKEIP